jgi:hypothetical protein
MKQQHCYFLSLSLSHRGVWHAAWRSCRCCVVRVVLPPGRRVCVSYQVAFMWEASVVCAGDQCSRQLEESAL